MRKIVIAGGGLAGLSLAAALRANDVPVTVIEAGRYPRHRVCGEFVSGVSPETLEKLGIAALFRDARTHRTLTWFEAGRPLHRDRLPDPALGISRFVLDDRLQQLVTALGGEIIHGQRAQPSPAEGRIWTAGKPLAKGHWLGLKAHLLDVPMVADLEMHTGSNGYVGLAGVEDRWVNVCGLFRIDSSLRGSAVGLLAAYLRKGGNSKLADRISNREARPGSFRAIAGFSFGQQPARPGLLRLGDAESLIPPFTGNGMSMAFQAAEIAHRPLVEWSAGRREWGEAANEIQAALHRTFRRRLKVAEILHRALLNPHGRAALRTFSSVKLLPFRPMLSLLR
jgi:flavin-dependent dehydrogenase